MILGMVGKVSCRYEGEQSQRQTHLGERRGNMTQRREGRGRRLEDQEARQEGKG